MLLSIIKRISKMPTINIALYNPNLPISRAIASSFYCKGVASGSYALSIFEIFPSLDESPTTITMNAPSP